MFATPKIDAGLLASWLLLGALTFVALSFLLFSQNYRKHMREHLGQGILLLLLSTVGGLISFVLFVFAIGCKGCMDEFLYAIGAIKYRPTTRPLPDDVALREFM